jgi:hypothetical protein
MKKILIIGGMHGNEPLGPQIVEKLRKNPRAGIDGLIANETAYYAHSRFIEQDMNRSFPGVKNSSEYEHRRPYELLKLAKKYDVVLDFHNTHCPENDCGFVGDTANPELYGIAAFFGLTKIVVADYDCINKYAPNCMSVEISLDSAENNSSTWLEKIVRLQESLSDGKLPKTNNITRYKFAYRMTIEDKERLDLDKKDLRAFQPLDPYLARELGVSDPAFPIFINDAYTPYNFGGILNKIG